MPCYEGRPALTTHTVRPDDGPTTFCSGAREHGTRTSMREDFYSYARPVKRYWVCLYCQDDKEMCATAPDVLGLHWFEPVDGVRLL
jgi:hypothetical protein